MGIMTAISNKVSQGVPTFGAMDVISHLMNQTGGIQGLIQKFEQQGMGHIMRSWIGNGANLPIDGQQLRAVFGDERITQVAEKSGLQSADILQKLSQHLPQLIDRLTPDGQVHPEKFSGSSLVSMGMSLFH